MSTNADKDVSRLDIPTSWVKERICNELIGVLDVTSIDGAVAVVFAGDAFLQTEVSFLRTWNPDP